MVEREIDVVYNKKTDDKLQGEEKNMDTETNLFKQTRRTDRMEVPGGHRRNQVRRLDSLPAH